MNEEIQVEVVEEEKFSVLGTICTLGIILLAILFWPITLGFFIGVGISCLWKAGVAGVHTAIEGEDPDFADTDDYTLLDEYQFEFEDE
jgi:hypothetical protein